LGCLALIAAAVGQALTFVLYASDLCLHQGNVVYACDYGADCGWSVLAFVFYLLSTLLVCPTPKPQPLCRAVCDRASARQQNDQQKVSDPCCYCFRYKKDKAPPAPDDGDEKKEKQEVEDQLENGNNRASAATAAPAFPDSGHGDTTSALYDDTVPDLPDAAGQHGAYGGAYGYPREVYYSQRSGYGSGSASVGGPAPPFLSSSASAASAPPAYGYPPPPPPSPYPPPYYYYYPPPPPPAAAMPPRHAPAPAAAAAPPPPASGDGVDEQYHYCYDPSSFANGEVTDGDLFFDSKTV
jgi:hypothetical protein